MKIRLFKILAVTAPALTIGVAPLITTNCSVDNFARDIDGSNWVGVQDGHFDPTDYNVDIENKTVTYWDATKIIAKNLVVPNYVWYGKTKYKVNIGQQCFYQAKEITGTVELNEFMEEIPDDCFNQATFVEQVIMHKYPKRIGDYAFFQCESLQGITVINEDQELEDNQWTLQLEYLGDCAFENTQISGYIDFTDTIEYVGERAFAHCMNIESVALNLSKKITEIQTQTFLDCVKLKDFYLSPATTKIGNNAFAECASLQTIHLAVSGLKLELGNFALYDCISFEGFSSTCTLSKVGEACFYRNISLAFRPWEHVSETISKNAFASCDINAIAFKPDFRANINDAAFSDCPNLSAIDFTAFDLNDDLPTWTGKEIFDNIVDTGVIILSKAVYNNEAKKAQWTVFAQEHFRNNWQNWKVVSALE